jgi:leucyl aminopeptidase
MEWNVGSESVIDAVGDWLIVGCPEGAWPGPLAALDAALGGRLTRLREQEDLTGKLSETVVLKDAAGLAAKRLLVIGLGKTDSLSEPGWLRAMQTAGRIITTKPVGRVVVALPEGTRIAPDRLSQQALTALEIAGQGQDLYRTEKKRHPISAVTLLAPADAVPGEVESGADRGRILGEAVNLARQLVNMPADLIYPETVATRASELAAQFGLTCDVLEQDRLEAEKMGSLLAVAKGSDRPARVVHLDYNAAPEGAPVLALIGKGVTFDSGGLSIKPNDGMLTMKCDMAGAATVLAAMTAIARLKLPIHVKGYLGLVENMTGGSAMKLGDVLFSRSGTTIEVLNTDAEGRLVLCDVIDYALSRGADYLVDLATLTGACVVALGEDVTGAMSNDQGWCDAVLSAAKACGEDTWQLPMFDHYAKLLESDVADIKNVGGRWGGAITAGKFLERFVKGRPWVHLDIAGPAFASSDKPHREGGGTGCMVRTLVELARNFSH